MTNCQTASLSLTLGRSKMAWGGPRVSHFKVLRVSSLKVYVTGTLETGLSPFGVVNTVDAVKKPE